jgi:hypothetical protein
VSSSSEISLDNTHIAEELLDPKQASFGKALFTGQIENYQSTLPQSFEWPD